MLDETLRSVEFSPAKFPSGGFSPGAIERLQEVIRRYITDLVGTSVGMAKRQGLDSISTTHVTEAARSVAGAPQRKLVRAIGILGTLLLGAFLPEFIKAAADNTALKPVWVVIGVIGVAMVVYEWSKS